MQKKRTLRDRMYQLSANSQPIIAGSMGGEPTPFLAKLFDPSLTLAQFFNTMFRAALVIGAMLAVLQLGRAGFVYMTTDLPGAKGNARSIIGNAIMGLLLLLAVWLILNQINPQILDLNILQNVTPATSGAPSAAPTPPTGGIPGLFVPEAGQPTP